MGVRLSDQKLVWSPAFEHFVASKQLLVMNSKTPLHTAVRYLRKKRELNGIFGDDEKTMELLLAAEKRARTMQAGTPFGARHRVLEAQLNMGTVYAAKAQELGADLGKWFELEATGGDKVPLFTLRGLGSPDSRLLQPHIPDLLLPTYTRALQGHWKKHVCDSVVDGLGKSPTRYHHMAVTFGGHEAVDSQEKRIEIQKIDKLLREHGRLSVWLAVAPVEFHGQIAKAMVDAAVRHGQWVFGIFESNALDTLTMERIEAAPESVYEELSAWVTNTIESLRLEEAKHTHRFVLPEFQHSGYQIRELVSFQDLAGEGARQCHCVAGYAKGVWRGTEHILSMRKTRSKESLTVHLTYKGVVKGLVLSQARGLQNRDCTDEEMLEVQKLVAAANIYMGLSRIGVRLAAGSIEQLLSNEQTFEKVSRCLTGVRTLVGKFHNQKFTSMNFKAKVAVLKSLKKMPRFGVVDFTDKKGVRNTSQLTRTSWRVLAAYLLSPYKANTVGAILASDVELLPF